MPEKYLHEIEVGDTVERMLGGEVPMKLKVTGVTHNRIYCGPWEFSRKTGAEIDEELGWDEYNTGSTIRPL